MCLRTRNILNDLTSQRAFLFSLSTRIRFLRQQSKILPIWSSLNDQLGSRTMLFFESCAYSQSFIRTPQKVKISFLHRMLSTENFFGPPSAMTNKSLIQLVCFAFFKKCGNKVSCLLLITLHAWKSNEIIHFEPPFIGRSDSDNKYALIVKDDLRVLPKVIFNNKSSLKPPLSLTPSIPQQNVSVGPALSPLWMCNYQTKVLISTAKSRSIYHPPTRFAITLHVATRFE